MNQPAPAPAVPDRDAGLPLLLLLFFGSGATGLLYEVLWMRRLTLVFGATQLAIATVLAAFMAGLALGAAVAGRGADRGWPALRTYGALELLIGAWALAFPWLLDGATGAYRAMVPSEAVGYWSSQSIRFVLMAALLMVPTAAMGATLPLLVRHGAGRLSRVGARTGLLYGFNTAGAVVGTWLTGFVLLPWLGVRSAELSAAGANIAIGVAALAWSMRASSGGPIDDREERAETEALLDLTPDPDRGSPRLVRFLVVALAVQGFCTMAFEVAWSRFLALMVGSSVYAFTTLLVAFLSGTAGGALVAAAWLRRPDARPGRLLVVSLVGAGLTAWLTHFAFGALPFLYVDLYALFDGGDVLVFVVQAVLAIVVMTPTTAFIGLGLPAAVALASDDASAVGRDVSRLYVANTAGAVVGALLAGFLLLPWLGIRDTLGLAVALEFVGAGVVLAGRAVPSRTRRLGFALLAGLVLLSAGARARWNPLMLSAGMYKYVSDLSDYSHEAVRNFALSDFELLYYEEGSTSVVTVARSLGSGNVWLANNGKVDASTQSDLRTQVLLGHLPVAYAPKARTALVVGLASGITAGSLALHPDLTAIDVLEIEAAVIEASHFFDEHNHHPLDDPRVRVIANDARNHLVLHRDRYDLIVNEPSNPWITGVANLFTREYLELCRSRLNPEGVVVQWIQTYGMATEDLQTLLRTVTGVFPHVLAFGAPDDSDLLLVASGRPLHVEPDDLDLSADDPRWRDRERVGLAGPMDLLSMLLMDRGGLVAAAGEGPPNTDDNVRIEFSAPLHIHYETSEANAALLRDYATGPAPLYLPALTRPEQRAFLVDLGDAWGRRKQFMDAGAAYEEALALAPGDPAILSRVAVLKAAVRAFLASDTGDAPRKR